MAAYATIPVTHETKAAFLQFVAQRQAETGKRVTHDDALLILLDQADRRARIQAAYTPQAAEDFEVTTDSGETFTFIEIGELPVESTTEPEDIDEGTGDEGSGIDQLKSLLNLNEGE